MRFLCMKKQDIQQLSTKTKDELRKQAEKIRDDIGKIAIERASKTLHNTAIISKKKKEFAQVLTALRQKEMTTS